jgi:hypothetical protein
MAHNLRMSANERAASMAAAVAVTVASLLSLP